MAMQQGIVCRAFDLCFYMQGTTYSRTVRLQSSCLNSYSSESAESVLDPGLPLEFMGPCSVYLTRLQPHPTGPGPENTPSPTQALAEKNGVVHCEKVGCGKQ